MNQDQVLSAVRSIGKLLGGGVGGLILAKYGVSAIDVTTIQGAIETIIGAGAAIAAVIASHKSNATPPAIK